DTIFALATGNAGPAGVAVVRISGPCSGSVLQAMTTPLPAPRRAVLRRLFDPRTGDLLDE
ncbi:unnamed protein product, partial [Discosporangium mesarthrocarpum]